MNLLHLEEVCEILRVSEPTVRRWLHERRQGKGRFPLPITAPRRKAKWRRSDIENYSENIDVISPPESAAKRSKRLRSVHKQLEAMGVKIPKGVEQ